MGSKVMKLNKLIKNVLIYLFLAVCSIICIFPLYWLFNTSLKSSSEVFSPNIIGTYKATFDNYKTVLLEDQFPRFLLNSAIISVATVLVCVPIGSMCGYAFARLPMNKKDTWFFMILTTRMAPAVTFAVPIYLMMVNLRLVDTKIGLIIIYVFSNLALCIWLTRGFFEDVPIEMEEAAMVDGVTNFGCFIRFAVPIARGGIIATAILIFIFTWNEFFYASILTQNNAKTFTVHLTAFFGSRRVLWGELSAASVIGSAIPILFAFATKKYIVRGISMGAVKG
ncbi:MAG: carbohydrate ABC transporter permease [Bacillota bacterium]